MQPFFLLAQMLLDGIEKGDEIMPRTLFFFPFRFLARRFAFQLDSALRIDAGMLP